MSGDLSSTTPEIECSDELPIPLRSVYASTRGEPSFTNCTPDFTGTLDYIFFCPSSDIKPVGFLELPGSDSEEVVGGLPNYYHPSDHLPIAAEFELDCDKVYWAHFHGFHQPFRSPMPSWGKNLVPGNWKDQLFRFELFLKNFGRLKPRRVRWR